MEFFKKNWHFILIFIFTFLFISCCYFFIKASNEDQSYINQDYKDSTIEGEMGNCDE